MQSFGLSDIGHVRSLNEDGYFIDDTVGIYFVTDGMGGVDGGEVASGMIVDQLPVLLKNTFEKNPDLSQTATQTIIQEDLHALNNLIYRQGLDQNLPGMGATLTLALIQNAVAYIFHIGDSRAYLMRDGQLQQLTVDQTEMENGYEVLSHAMGQEEHLQAVVNVHKLEEQDYVLLCSDGLHHMISDKEIAQAFQKDSLECISKDLLQRALWAGGEDNCTVVVMQY